MEDKQRGILLLYKHKEIVDTLTDEEAGKLFKAIFDYEINGVEPEDKLIKMAMFPIKTLLDDNKKKYENVCERNRINGLKGGRPKKNLDKPSVSQENLENPMGYLGIEENPKNLKDKDKTKDKDKDNISLIDKLYDYIQENYLSNLNNVDYERVSALLEDFTYDEIIKAVDTAKTNGGCSIQYVSKILHNPQQHNKKEITPPEWLNKEIKQEKDEWVISEEDKIRFGL